MSLFGSTEGGPSISLAAPSIPFSLNHQEESMDVDIPAEETILDSTDTLDAFAGALEKLYLHQSNELDVLQTYVEAAAEEANQSFLSQGADSETGADYTLEAQFWSLVADLYRFRASDIAPMDEIPSYSSNVLIQEKDLLETQEKKEKWIILHWLQSNFKLVTDKNMSGIKWSNTRMQLQHKSIPNLKIGELGSVLNNYKPTEQTVTQLDLDAPIRQDKKIAKEDVELDNRVFERVFELLRANQYDDALELCSETGNLTLKMCIQGSHEYVDLEIDGPLLDLDSSNDTMSGGSGIENMALLRRTCWNMAQQNVDVFERAVYGVLASDLKSLLEVSNDWESQLYAFLANMVAFESEESLIKAGRIDIDSLQVLDGNALNPSTTSLKVVLNMLAQSVNPVVRKQAEHNYRSLIGSAINRSAGTIIQDLAKYFKEAREALQTDEIDESDVDFDLSLLRVVTHYALFLKSVEENAGDDESIAILVESYIAGLAIRGRDFLAPLYISYLPEELANSVYAKLLVDITDTERRKEHLTLAAKYKLDIEEILKLVVASTFAETQQTYSHEEQVTFTSSSDSSDQRRISGVQWYVLAGMWVDAAHSAIYGFRDFLSCGKFEAAREFGSAIGVSAVIKTYEAQLINAGGVSELPAGHRYELLQYDRLVNCLQAVKSWNDFYESLSESGQLTRESSREAFVILKALDEEITSFAREWMVNVDYEKNSPEWRLLDEFRTRYVPFLIMSYLEALIEAQMIKKSYLKRAGDLATMVAAENEKLYVLFNRSGCLKEFLQRLAVACRDGLGNGEESTSFETSELIKAQN